MFRLFIMSVSLLLSLNSVSLAASATASDTVPPSLVTLPSGLILFKGFPHTSQPITRYFWKKAWFSTELETANLYTFPRTENTRLNPQGPVHAYQLLQEIQVLDLSDVNTVAYLKSLATEANDHDTQRALDVSFRINATGGLERESEAETDKIIADFICNNNFKGYSTTRLGNVGPEILLCAPDALHYNTDNPNTLMAFGPRYQYLKSESGFSTPVRYDAWAELQLIKN